MARRGIKGLTYANVMSTIAVFSVLGGGAYAASQIGPRDIEQNAVRSKHIKDSQVKTADLRDGSVNASKVAAESLTGASVLDGSLSGADVTDDSLTGGDIAENSLGIVPDADQLDGKDASEFMSSDDAWAYVISNGGLHASSGNLTVTHPATGEYCVLVTRRGSHKAAQATLSDPGGNTIISVGTGHGSACNPLNTDTHDAIPVFARNPANSPVDANFTIYVPAP
ncbi:MAG: hypothetical protein M3355_09650 [Actinomycetota bacterium]|nr:hypothetical protein [Actinomycetota bacterium]